jgi:hypothetical protein
MEAAKTLPTKVRAIGSRREGGRNDVSTNIEIVKAFRNGKSLWCLPWSAQDAADDNKQ